MFSTLRTARLVLNFTFWLISSLCNFQIYSYPCTYRTYKMCVDYVNRFRPFKMTQNKSRSHVKCGVVCVRSPMRSLSFVLTYFHHRKRKDTSNKKRGMFNHIFNNEPNCLHFERYKVQRRWFKSQQLVLLVCMCLSLLLLQLTMYPHRGMSSMCMCGVYSLHYIVNSCF